MRKEGTVVRHCLQRLSMLGRMIQDLEARHNATLDFIQDYLAAKLDQRTAFVAGDGSCMWLE